MGAGGAADPACAAAGLATCRLHPSQRRQEDGPNTYLVTENYSRGLCDEARNRAVSRVSQYCFRMDRKVPIQKSCKGRRISAAQEAPRSLLCLYQGNPELQRGK